jgi:hypothetical protein
MARPRDTGSTHPWADYDVRAAANHAWCMRTNTVGLRRAKPPRSLLGPRIGVRPFHSSGATPGEQDREGTPWLCRYRYARDAKRKHR